MKPVRSDIRPFLFNGRYWYYEEYTVPTIREARSSKPSWKLTGPERATQGRIAKSKEK